MFIVLIINFFIRCCQLSLLYTGSLTDSDSVVESGSLQPLPPPVQSPAEGSG